MTLRRPERSHRRLWGDVFTKSQRRRFWNLQISCLWDVSETLRETSQRWIWDASMVAGNVFWISISGKSSFMKTLLTRILYFTSFIEIFLQCFSSIKVCWTLKNRWKIHSVIYFLDFYLSTNSYHGLPSFKYLPFFACTLFHNLCDLLHKLVRLFYCTKYVISPLFT